MSDLVPKFFEHLLPKSFNIGRNILSLLFGLFLVLVCGTQLYKHKARILRKCFLLQGYGGADEAKMLQRHLYGISVKIGVGANRAVTAASFLKRYGHISPRKHGNSDLDRLFSDNKKGNSSYCDQIGVAILDDGMQVCAKTAF